jgi:hypothetical protein
VVLKKTSKVSQAFFESMPSIGFASNKKAKIMP